MAFYKVLEKSFIGYKLVEEGEVVNINDDPENGGMTPSGNLAKCDENGNLEATKPAKKKATAADLG